MMVSIHKLSISSMYGNNGNFLIPKDGKIISVLYDGFDAIDFIYSHNTPNEDMNKKLIFWYKIEDIIYNQKILSDDRLDLKYGAFFQKRESRTGYKCGHILYQSEMTIDEIRDIKLDYLLK